MPENEEPDIPTTPATPAPFGAEPDETTETPVEVPPTPESGSGGTIPLEDDNALPIEGGTIPLEDDNAVPVEPAIPEEEE